MLLGIAQKYSVHQRRSRVLEEFENAMSVSLLIELRS